MKVENWNFNWLSLPLAVIFLIPFLIVTKYTYLSADDFCRASANFEDYFLNISVWYVEHNGRFINSLLSYMPIYEPGVYRITLAFLMLILGFTVYLFSLSIFRFFKLPLSRDKIFFFSILFCISIIGLIPSLYQFFYWYAGATAYLVSVIFFLLWLVSMRNLYDHHNKTALLPALLVVLVNGNNEMLLILSNFIIIIIWYAVYKNRKEINLKMFIIFAASVISSLLVLFSPGSGKRQAAFLGGGDFFFSLKAAVLSSGMFSIKDFFNPEFLLLYLGLFFLIIVWSKKSAKRCRTLNPFILASISFIALVVVVFVPYFATGYLKIRSGRIGNLIHIIWLIFLVINLINAALYFNKYYTIKSKVASVIPVLFITGFLCVLLLQNNNYNNLMIDFKNGSLSHFEKENAKRILILKNTKNKIIELRSIKGPKTLTPYEITTDYTNWENKCFVNGVNKIYGKNFEYIFLKN